MQRGDLDRGERPGSLCVKSKLDEQILAYLTIGRIGWDVAIQMWKISNPKSEVISLVVDADLIWCVAITTTDFHVEITRFRRFHSDVLQFQFGWVNFGDVISKIIIVNAEQIVDEPDGVA